MNRRSGVLAFVVLLALAAVGGATMAHGYGDVREQGTATSTVDPAATSAPGSADGVERDTHVRGTAAAATVSTRSDGGEATTSDDGTADGEGGDDGSPGFDIVAAVVAALALRVARDRR